MTSGISGICFLEFWFFEFNKQLRTAINCLGVYVGAHFTFLYEPLGPTAKSTIFFFSNLVLSSGNSEGNSGGNSAGSSGGNGTSSGSGNSAPEAVLNYGPQWRRLGYSLYRERRSVISHRPWGTSGRTRNEAFTLAELGFRGPRVNRHWTEKRVDDTFLLEAFIDRNPHLPAFHQYRGWNPTPGGNNPGY